MRLSTVIEGIGVVMMWVGMSAMDSVNLLIPTVLVFGGIALMFCGASMEQNEDDEDEDEEDDRDVKADLRYERLLDERLGI